MNQVRVKSTGGIVYWAATQTGRERLESELQTIGLDTIVPHERTREAALKVAMRKLVRPHGQIVLPLQDKAVNGFEARSVVESSLSNTVSHEFSAAPRDGGMIEITSGFLPENDREQLQAEFALNRHAITGAMIGTMLAKYVARLGGVCLRPSGAIYWIPEHAIDQWDALGKAIERANPGNRVYLVRHEVDADTARAVRDAIVAEVSAAAKEMTADVAAGDLGKRALQHRVNQANVIRQKVGAYELILGEALTSIRDTLSVAEQSASSALAVAESETFDPLFGDDPETVPVSQGVGA